jgi:hypothetical protein
MNGAKIGIPLRETETERERGIEELGNWEKS